MKYRLLSLTAIASFVIICATVNAEEFGNCKTMYNGQCIEYYTPVEFMQKQGKTMQTGEYFEHTPVNTPYTNNNVNSPDRTSNVEKSYNTPKLDCRNRYGFGYLMDPYYLTRNKFWITDIEPNSPAQRAGLKIGDEILKVNENKVNKMNIDMFDNAISPNSITLEIKNDSGKRTISMKRANICTPIKEEDALFNSYWEQIYTDISIDDANEFIKQTSRVRSKLSSGFIGDLRVLEDKVSYWQPKKTRFQNGYNTCKANYITDMDLHTCLSTLVNRELAQIQHEEYIRQQQEIFQAQQKMQQQQVDALNNYSDALRNQHVNVNQNVYHSGNVNHNVNGTYNHYYRGW